MSKLAILLLVALLYSIKAALLGNYKLYDSKGSGLYDSSGNGNHGEISWTDNPILTDRGQYFYPRSSLKFPSNVYKSYPGGSDLIIALWLVAASDGTLLKVTSYYNNSINTIKIVWEQNLTEVNLRFIDATSFTTKTTSLKFSNIYSDTWNFVVFLIHQSSSNTQISLYPDAINTPTVTHTFNGFQFANSYTTWGIKESGVNELKGFIYEIWWRNDLLPDVSTSFSSYASPSPTKLTNPPEMDPFKSYNSISCSLTCNNNKQSCSGSASSCITICNSGCSCGCYRITADVCLGCKLIYCSIYDNASATCATCMSNLVPNNGTCQCSTGSELITIISSPQCRSPVSNCLRSYTNPENGCAECNTSYKLICLTPPCPPLYECTATCPSGYYENLTSPASCPPCSSNCITCTDSTTCTQCSDTTYLKSGACVAACGSGYYTNQSRTCEQCSSYCSTCTYSKNSLACVGCDSGYYLQGTVCVTECAAEYYSNGGICYQCPSNCSACTSSSNCTSCLAGYGLITSSNSRICNTCPMGEYASSSVCSNCPGTCTACSSDTVCSSCIANASITVSSTVCSCNFGFTFSSGICVRSLSAAATMNTNGTINLIFSSTLGSDLNPNTLTFRDGSLIYDSTTFTMNTVIANLEYIITLNKILLTGVNTMRLYFSSATIYAMNDESLSIEYLDIDIIDRLIISQCSSILNCSTCIDAGLNFICDSCRGSYCLYTDSGVRCGSCCEPGYYMMSINSSNNCIKCPAECYTCTSTSSCSSCIGSLYLLNNNCVSDCGYARYNNMSNNECSDCPENCEACSDGNSCSLCVSSTVYHSSTNKCEACPAGSYYEGGVCVACPALCASCTNSISCTECVSNASISQEHCTCNPSYTNIDNTCMPVTFLQVSSVITSYQTISITFNKSLQSPLTADSLILFIQGISYTSSSFSLQMISPLSYIITTKNITFLNIFTITLIFLNPSSIISLDSSTLEQSSLSISVPVEIMCVSSTGSPSICENCPDVCLLCSSSGCLKCNESYLLLESVCREECPDGYYEDIVEDRCLSCGENCISCEYEDSRVVCNECGDRSVMIYREEVVECIEYGDTEENVCQECGGLCSEYEEEGCSVCMENSEMSNSKCEDINSEEDSNEIDVKLISANIQYLTNKQFHLSFARPPTVDLSSSSLSILSNSILYSPSQFTLSKQSTFSPSSYLITISNLNTSIPNTITFTFLSKLSSSEGYFPSKLTLKLPADSSETSGNSESYSQAEIEQADTVESISSGMTTTATVGAAVSIASGGSQAWGMLNTIQILSFLALLQVEMPLLLKSCIKAQENYYPSYDLFQSIQNQSKKPYQKALDFKYRTSDFILNSGKPIFILLILISIYILTKLFFKFTKGKLKQTFEKVTNMFSYGIYLRFFIQMYLEFSVPAVLQILYVIIIQAQDDTIFQIIAYNVAIAVLLLCIFLPLFIIKLLMSNFTVLEEDEFKNVWGVLYQDFDTNKLAIQYYGVFFVRRLGLAVSFSMLKEYAVIQILVCSSSCLMIFVYLVAVRPFKSKVQNILNIVSELNITVGYFMNLFFVVETGIEDEIIAWIIVGVIAITYIIHNVLLFFNIARTVFTQLKERCTKKPEVIVVPTNPLYNHSALDDRNTEIEHRMK